MEYIDINETSKIACQSNGRQFLYSFIDGDDEFNKIHQKSPLEHTKNSNIGKELYEIICKEPISTTSEIERDSILYPKFVLDNCIGCGRCYISCFDGGHQAIEFNTETRKPKLLGNKCVGCHLCRLVCPTSSIGIVKSRITRNTTHE